MRNREEQNRFQARYRGHRPLKAAAVSLAHPLRRKRHFSLYIPVLAGRAIDGIKLHGNVDFEVIKKCLFGILICAIVGGVLQW